MNVLPDGVNPIIKVIELEHQPNKQIQETSYVE